MSKLIDLTGQKFGRLTVIKRVEKPQGLKKKETYWLCLCDCGKETTVIAYSLKSGRIKSCGCYHKEKCKTHNKSNNKLYWIRSSIIQRCFNSNDHNFYRYGGRGITICDEWRNNFEAFYDWAISNGYREGLSIDRINNDGNYEPSNCRWVTQKVQSNNTRKNHLITINGEVKTMQQWADLYNMSKHTFYARYAKGLRGEDLIAPLKRQRERNKK